MGRAPPVWAHLVGGGLTERRSGASTRETSDTAVRTDRRHDPATSSERATLVPARCSAGSKKPPGGILIDRRGSPACIRRSCGRRRRRRGPGTGERAPREVELMARAVERAPMRVPDGRESGTLPVRAVHVAGRVSPRRTPWVPKNDGRELGTLPVPWTLPASKVDARTPWGWTLPASKLDAWAPPPWAPRRARAAERAPTRKLHEQRSPEGTCPAERWGALPCSARSPEKNQSQGAGW